MKLAKNIFFLFCILAISLPLVSFAQTPCFNTTTPSTQLCNGLGTVTTAEGVAGIFFAYLGTIIALLAIIMLVYSGFRMILSQGDPEALKVAKAGFRYAIIGFVIAALAFVFVLAFQNFLGVDSNSVSPGQFRNPLSSGDFRTVIEQVLRNSVALVGFVALLMILYNSYMYISGGVNEEQLKKAKSGLLWSVVGFLTTILAYVIILSLYNLLS